MSFKILVCDDEPAVLKVIKLVLEKKGYQATTVQNGREALEALRTGSFDCLVTDAIMPVLSGFDLTRAVRKDPKDGQIPIIMLTRKRHRLDVRQALDAGVTDYVLKPVDEQLLLDKLETTLKKSKAGRELFVGTISALQASADLLMRSEITTLSESGATLLVPCELPPDYSCEARTAIFEEMGIRPPLMRVIAMTKLPEARKSLAYEAKFTFVGVAEPDLMRIRSWLQKEAIRRRK